MDKNRKRCSIRRACQSDTSRCIALSRQSWPEWWRRNDRLGRQHMRKCLRQTQGFVAVNGKKIVGFVIWGTLWNKIHLQDIFVIPEVRRMGVGETMVYEVVRIAKHQGYQEIMSDCDVTNRAAIRFHVKVGFQKCGNIIGNWDGVDSQVFVMKLCSNPKR